MDCFVAPLLAMTLERDKLTRRANHFRFTEIVSSPRIKNISLYQKAKSVVHSCPSRPTQRGVGHRHNEGRVAVDVKVAFDERRWSVRRKRVVLAPVTASSFWEVKADQRRRWQ